MSESIKVGDLVRVVHACCGEFAQGRTIFQVYKFFDRLVGGGYDGFCMYCHAKMPHERQAFATPHLGTDEAPTFPLSWLRRIPPLEELDDVKREEEITA